MKKSITQLLGVCITLASLMSACKKDEVQVVATPSGQPMLAASASTVVLSQVNANQTAITFNWKPLTTTISGTDKSYTQGTTYQLQFAKIGTSFAKPASLDAGAGPNTTVSVSDLNNALQTLGLTAGMASQVEVRLNATYASNYVLSSPGIPLTATTYSFCGQPAVAQAWTIIGPAGKDWSTDITLQYDCAAKTYTYTGPLSANVFKFRYGGQWKDNLDLGGAWSSTGGSLTQAGDNITVPVAGTYTIVLTPGTIDGSNKITGASYTVK